MLFITNRFRKGSIQSRVGAKYQFDLRINTSPNAIYCCGCYGNGDYKE